MSILDMDVTPRRHAGYIRTREFASIRKGYDPAQVRQFLDQVAGWFSEMEDDLANSRTAEVNARAQAEAAASGRAALARTPEGEAVAGADDKYAALGARVAEVLRTAEEHAAQVREEAEASVHQMLEQARLESTSLRHRAQEEADAIRVSAQQQAETTRQAAQDDADRVRDEAARALETARVEAERTVAGLTERRTVLTAELQATRA
ncbi:MAG TPA: DivIVA domain-containing protein, partial [Actinomycetota bacterium]|nr:DivIVA domain-containing protein [Actinomycetota bacterium]